MELESLEDASGDEWRDGQRPKKFRGADCQHRSLKSRMDRVERQSPL